MADSKYSDEVRAAVMAALLAGQSPKQVSNAHRIPYQTVYTWYRQLSPEDYHIISEQKKQEIGNKIILWLDASLEALKAQAELFSDEKWLAEQEASQLGVLYGIVADKSTRIIETIGRLEGSNTEDNEA